MSDLLSQDVLVISQKSKVIEMTNEYRIMDGAGTEIGGITEEGQSKAKKVVRLLTDLDQFLTHRLAVTDASGERVLTMERPAKVMKSKIKIRDGSGADRGTISQGNIVGKKHFSLSSASGEQLGTLDAENWRAWTFRSETRAAPRSARSRRSDRTGRAWAARRHVPVACRA